MNSSFLSPAKAISIKPSSILYFFLLSVVFTFSSCIANRMVPFDAEALTTTKALKNDALNLMGQATGAYDDNVADINAFQQKLEDHISYEQNRGEKNQTTVDMWKILANPDGNLLGGFLKKWKAEGTLNQIFITQIKRQVGDNFNKIINLENKKKK